MSLLSLVRTVFDEISRRRARQFRSSAGRSTQIVPYEERRYPLVEGPVGDIQSFIHLAEQAPMLSEDYEEQLIQDLSNPRKEARAREILTLSHLRLVIALSRQFSGYGLNQADLIQEGNVGLLKAIKNFKAGKGARLATYAATWIRAEMQEFVLRNWRMTRIATTKNQRKLFFKFRQLKGDGPQPVNEETAKSIADKLDVKVRDVYDMEYKLSTPDFSLDAPVNEEDADSPAFLDSIADTEPNPEGSLLAKFKDDFMKTKFREAINSLDPRSRRIIEARYLQDDGGKTTLSKLGEELGLSVERTRQIETQALKKLRSALSDYAI